MEGDGEKNMKQERIERGVGNRVWGRKEGKRGREKQGKQGRGERRWNEQEGGDQGKRGQGASERQTSDETMVRTRAMRFRGLTTRFRNFRT